MRQRHGFRFFDSLVRDQEVDGSNPFAPTTSKPLALIEFKQPLLRQLKRLCCGTMEQLKSRELWNQSEEVNLRVGAGLEQPTRTHVSTKRNLGNDLAWEVFLLAKQVLSQLSYTPT